eukprot:5011557-Prymnesium_polylepis.1
MRFDTSALRPGSHMWACPPAKAELAFNVVPSAPATELWPSTSMYRATTERTAGTHSLPSVSVPGF